MEYRKIRTITFAVLSGLFVLLFSGGVMAQTEESQEIKNERKTLDYVPATHANLSQLLWKFRYYEADDENIINDFMKTRNCKLYYKYQGNEFILKNALEGLRREIKYYGSEYPSRFEILSLIPLGKYDFDKLAFEILPGYELRNEGAIEFPFPKQRESGCDDTYTSNNFPEKMKFLPDNKYLVDHVPVYPENADPMLNRLSEVKHFGFSSNKRVVVARIRIKANSVDTFDDYYGVVFRGQLDEIAFFEDQEMTKLIWSKSFKDLK